MTGAKDPDEYIKKYGSERFRLLLEQAGDAVNFRLDRCAEGLDTATEAGKVQLLKRMVSVLAEIQNPLERGVYLSRTANQWDISRDVLEQQVQRHLRTKNRLEKTKAWKEIMDHTIRPEPQQPQSSISLKETRAEETILCYLLNRPEEAEWLSTKLTADAFSSPLYQQVFQHFLDCVREHATFSLSALGRVLSDAEMGKISGISAKHQEIHITSEEVQECIGILLDKSIQSVETDDDLLSLIQKKQHPPRI